MDLGFIDASCEGFSSFFLFSFEIFSELDLWLVSFVFIKALYVSHPKKMSCNFSVKKESDTPFKGFGFSIGGF